MKNLYLLILFFTLRNLYCQSPDVQWSMCLGGSSTDRGRSIIETEDGGFITLGSAWSNDGDVSGNHGSYDLWIVKLDENGNLIWQKSLGGSSWDDGATIIACNDGNFIIAASTYSDDGDITFNNGWYDMWIIKITGLGDIIWSRTYGGSYSDNAYNIQQTFDSGFVICGIAGSNDGDITGYHGSKDFWVIKTDSLGELMWQKCLGGSDYDQSYSIIQTPDAGFLVCGNSLSDDGDVTGIDAGDNGNIWLVKLSDSGELMWQKNFGGNASDYAYSLKNTPEGGYIIAGTTSSVDEDVEGNHGETDIWIIKLNAAGAVIWKQCYGGTGYDGANDIIVSADGGYVIAGYTFSIDGDITEYFGNYDYWIVKINEEGTLQWQKSLGANLNEKCYGIKETTDGGYIVTGETKSNYGAVSGNHGEDDYWIVKLFFCTPLLYYADIDGDGYGDFLNDTLVCDMPFGYVTDFTDCVDTDPNIHPFSMEYCNGTDDDCDFIIDEDTLFMHWFADMDADGFGDLNSDSISCSLLIEYVFDSTDCNDLNPEIHPFVSEICNGLDDNCNMIIDDDPFFMHWFMDMDGDGFGDPENDSVSCFILTGYIFDSTDCNDLDILINPLQVEICNALDDDCNFAVDEGLPVYLYYEDLDADGYGNALIFSNNCSAIAPLGYVTNNSDCDDALSTINPAQTEICNGMDDNCNLISDEGITYNFLYPDTDMDGYGDPFAAIYTCFEELEGYSENNLDCDDTNAGIFPGAAEILNGLDDNCNTAIDEGLVDIFSATPAFNFDMFPNPANKKFTIIASGAFAEKNIVQIFNSAGSLIYFQEVVFNPIGLSVEISPRIFSDGIYMVRVSSGKNAIQKMLIIAQ